MNQSVVLVSAGLVHPSLPVRFLVRRALETTSGYQFRQVSSLEALPRLALDAYRAIVLYVHHETISPAALDCLEHFVAEGGGLLAIHSASASFKQEPRFYDLLGGRFVEHGPIETFEVQPVSPAQDAFAGIAPFSVRDELYRHEYGPENHIHFFTLVDGGQEPVVWTRSHDPGRVCYCSLGHTVNSVRNPQTQQILQRGLAWVCGASEGGAVSP
jgi:type 1 glutamine amidotransferase